MPLIPTDKEGVVGSHISAIAPRIGAARDAEKRLLKWKRDGAALHQLERCGHAWSRKKIKTSPSRKPEVSTGAWNDLYTPADDLSRLK